jgi:hypothetical protein
MPLEDGEVLDELKIVNKVATAIRRLKLPNKFTILVLRDLISEQIGQQIDFFSCFMPMGWTGFVVPGECLHILFASDVSPIHQAQIMLHELGHVTLRHVPNIRAIENEPVLQSFITSTTSYKGLPNVVLKRETYNNTQEMEAELFATQLLGRIIFDKNLIDDPLFSILIE